MSQELKKKNLKLENVKYLEQPPSCWIWNAESFWKRKKLINLLQKCASLKQTNKQQKNEINKILCILYSIRKCHNYKPQERARKFTLEFLFVTLILDRALLESHPEGKN